MVRVWMIYDTHQVELPNHETALRNLDYTDRRLLVKLIYPPALAAFPVDAYFS